ncbi:hypothetical protein, partial [Enterocloster bolteae]
EFFHVNKYLDFMIDIYSIKVYFSTEFHKKEQMDTVYGPLNYLDYTNPNGEGIIINTFKVKGLAVYINDVLISAEDLPRVYHFLRRRKYHWTWYTDNNISKKEIVDYLKIEKYRNGIKGKIYYLCEEMGLIHNGDLTITGASLLGGEKVERNKDINYILNEVILRGYDDNPSECNDFVELIQRKDFKDLIALEIYEYYFWDDRHEFDLQLIKGIVESVSAYFSQPDIILQMESGLLQNIPSEIILALVAAIWFNIKKIAKKKDESNIASNSWLRIEKNIKKIDNEFSNHDYVLTDEIEKIFGESREEIQPLLKLCGCKCFMHKNRSIWIKVGIKEERIREILEIHHFKYRR